MVAYETPAENTERETVLVVHGTFSGKEANAPPKWYEPGEFFCRQLDRELQGRGSSARCWAHLKPGEDFFHWDGRNNWLSRAKAADTLRKEVRRLNAKGWAVHLVGHSHGGNVIISAIMGDGHKVLSWYKGKIALLGTPIYESSWEHYRRQGRRLFFWVILSLVFWAALAWYSLTGLPISSAFDEAAWTVHYAELATIVAGFAAIVLIARVIAWLAERFPLWSVFDVVTRIIPSNSEQAPKPRLRTSPRIMLINSRYDEAFRSLASLRESANPLIGDTGKDVKAVGGLSSLLILLESWHSRASSIIQNTLKVPNLRPVVILGSVLLLCGLFWEMIASFATPRQLSASSLSLVYIAGVTSVLVLGCFAPRVFGQTCLLPGLIGWTIPNFVWAIASGTISTVLDRVLREQVWRFVRSFSLGVGGAPRSVDEIDVSKELRNLAPEDEDYLYLELPASTVERVKALQKPLLSDLQELVYDQRMKWSPDTLMMKLSKHDYPMIHTTYYKDIACIRKMAHWLADPIVARLDGTYSFPMTRIVRTEGKWSYGYQDSWVSANEYREHLNELRNRYCPKGSRWAEGGGEVQLEFDFEGQGKRRIKGVGAD